LFPKTFFGLETETVHARDVDTFELNGVTMVIANGRGVSVFDIDGIRRSPMTGWVWKFSANTPMPIGLRIVQDSRHHYCIAPVSNMPIGMYKGLLEKLALFATRIFEKPGVRA